MNQYKVEGHLHVKGNSWCGKTSAGDILRLYKENGYDAIIVTNHFNRHLFNNYFSGTEDERFASFFAQYNELKANDLGIKVYFGVEFALRDDHYHFRRNKKCAELLVYGITPDEFRKYALKIVEMDYPEVKKLADEMGWLVFQAHPFRGRTKRVDVKCLHGVETFNGNPRHHNHNRRAQAYAKKNNLLEVIGSDFHEPQDMSSAMLFYELPTDEKALVEVLKNHTFDTLRGKKALKNYSK